MTLSEYLSILDAGILVLNKRGECQGDREAERILMDCWLHIVRRLAKDADDEITMEVWKQAVENIRRHEEGK